MTAIEYITARLDKAEGVRVFVVHPEHWEHLAPGHLGVKIARVCGTAGPEGAGITLREMVEVPTDLAADLSRGPEAVVSPGWGDERGLMGIRIDVLGFIEHEAEAAFNTVRAAMETF